MIDSMKKIFFIFFIVSSSLVVFFANLSSQQTAGELFQEGLYLEEGQGDRRRPLSFIRGF